jgi:hypothetical protein
MNNADSVLFSPVNDNFVSVCSGIKKFPMRVQTFTIENRKKTIKYRENRSINVSFNISKRSKCRSLLCADVPGGKFATSEKTLPVKVMGGCYKIV